MKSAYYNTPNAAIAVNFKSGSATLARAIVQEFQPELDSILTTPDGDGNGTAYPAGKSADNIRWHGVVDKCDPLDKDVTLLLVRDSVDKFCSACAEDNVTDIDAHLSWIEANPSMPRRMHFWPQSRLLQGYTVKLYRFPTDFDALATDAGLTLPLSDIAGNNPPKPDLTADQLTRVQAIYADDIALYDSIVTAGQVYDAPPVLATEADKAAKLAEIAKERWEKEVGGVIVDGMPVRTDDHTFGRLAAGIAEVRNDPIYTVNNWKIATGAFITLDANTITVLHEAVKAHIADVFAEEAQRSAAVAAATTVEELDAI